MRVTASTGTVGAGAVLQITRAFTSCALRKRSSEAWIRRLHQNPCRALSTCCEMK